MCFVLESYCFTKFCNKHSTRSKNVFAHQRLSEDLWYSKYGNDFLEKALQRPFQKFIPLLPSDQQFLSYGSGEFR